MFTLDRKVGKDGKMEDIIIREVMLSTIDNPFDYFTDFSSWNDFDTRIGKYNSLELVGRLAAGISEDEDPINQSRKLEKEIDDFLALDFMGKYIKVVKYTKLEIINPEVLKLEETDDLPLDTQN